MSFLFRSQIDGINYQTDPGETLAPNQIAKLNYRTDIPNADNSGIYYPVYAGAAAPTTLLSVSNTSYFQYMTRAKRAYTSAIVVCNITSAGAGTVTYNEVGIFKGPVVFGPSPGTWTLGTMPALTRVATANLAAVSTGRKATTVALTGINPGDDLWAVISCQNGTTQPTFTALADILANALTGTQATYRPSTGASPVTPTAVATAIPLLAAQFS